MPEISLRAEQMPASPIRKLVPLADAARARGTKIYHLNIGQPDLPSPKEGLESLKHIDRKVLEYSPSDGYRSLREKLATYYEQYRIKLSPEEIIVTTGGSEAVLFAFMSCLNPGDEIIVPEPAYANYMAFAISAGAVIRPVVSSIEQGFALPDVAEFEKLINDRTRGILICNPNNPTGGVMDAADLEAIAEVLRGTDIMVLSDEIYAELTYGLDRHISIATLPGMKERTIVVNGFSKAYAMTGWRLGYAVGPEPVIKVMTKIHQSCIMSAPTTSQYAAIAALRSCDDSIEMMRDEYNRRRRYVVKALNDMGLTCFEPRGAFYVFPCIRCSGLTSQEFCEMLLKEQEVAIIPGDAFGASGEGYARISYAYSVEHLETAMRRIRTFLKDHGWLAE